jgi:hypothetical protein
LQNVIWTKMWAALISIGKCTPTIRNWSKRVTFLI